MSNLLEQTDYFVKSKRYEKKSGKWPNKIKFTAATKLSLQKNIDYKFLDKAINKLNTIYSEMISAVEIAEKVKAEEEARSKISGNKELESKIEEDEKISKMTDAAIVNKRMKRVVIELLKLAGRIGTYKDNYGINAKKGFTPKSPRAISVPKLYSDVYKSLMSKIDLYKMAEKKGLEVSENGEVVVSDEDVPSWRKLFDNMKNVPSEVTVAMNKSNDDEEEKTEFVQPSSNKVTDEDLAYRKMLGQLGDEFELIESYERSTNGVPSQFKDGFESRKQNLSRIFFDLTGIEARSKTDELVVKDNTEFQNLIDQVNGYKEPLTEQEHKAMEDSLNEYYSRDEVSSKISELNEKDVLYTFNQHMDDVIKAEIKDNNKDAVDVVQVSNEETAVNEEELARQKELAELKAGADEQARMLKTLYDYMDKRDRFEAEKAEREKAEREALLAGAEEQARMLNDTNMAIDAAHEVAQKIASEQVEELKQAHMKDMIVAGAQEEAQRIVNAEIKEQEQEKMNQMIATSAQEEAQRIVQDQKNLAEQSKMNDMIAASAEVEAHRLNDLNMVIDGADEQARILVDKERQEANRELLASAEVEAHRLNDLNMVIDGADEQARILVDKERQAARKEIIEGANYEAQRLYDLNMIAEGADEQARQLQQNNEYLDIRESADVQAKILLNRDKKESLLEEAKALSERLKSISEEADKIDLSIAKSAKEDVMDNTFDPNNVKKDVDEEIISSAQEEAQRLHEKNVILSSADEEAKKIHTRNVILESAEQEAQRLQAKNDIIDSAQEEAQRLHENNIMLDSAEKEAQRIYDNNVMLDSAEEEAKRLIAVEQTSQAQQAPIVSQVTPMINPVVPEANQGTPVVAPIVPMVSKEAPVVQATTSSSNLQLLDIKDRYGELTKKSNPLLVKKARIDNITSRVNNNAGKPVNKKKEILNTLKEELETGNYSFLQRSDNMEEMVPQPKAA